MKIRTIAQNMSFVAVGFLVTAGLMLIYGGLLGLLWEHVYQAPWPMIGPNGAGAMFRARLFDALFGLTAGVVLAVAAVRVQKALRFSVSTPVIAGAFLYVATAAVSAANIVTAIVESPIPALLIGLCAASWWLREELMATSIGDGT